MASTLQMGGLASGLDTNAIIDALVDVERNKIRIVESQKASYEYKVSAYGDLLSKLSSFQSSSYSMNSAKDFALFKGSSDDEDYATIEGESGAVSGEYVISVSQKAVAETLASITGKITDNSAAILSPGDSATISINGTNINIDDTDTIRDVALLINNATDTEGNKLDVKASVLKVSDNDYRLVLASTKTGTSNELNLSDVSGAFLQDLGIINDAAGSKGNIAASSLYSSSLPIPQSGAMGATGAFEFTGTDHNGNTVDGSFTLTGRTTEELISYVEGAYGQSVDASVDASGNLIITDKTTGESQFSINITNDGNLGLGTAVTTAGVTGSSTIRVAQDAFFTVNGIGVQSDSNSADDVATGVTFNILKADPNKEVVLKLENDYDGVKGLVQGFLDSYNGIIDYLNEKSQYSEASDDKKSANGPLAGDWTSSRIKSDLRKVMITQFSEWDNSSYNALIRVGIKTDAQTGKMEIDDKVFKKVFEDDFDSIVKLFTPTGSSTNANISYGMSTTDTNNGKYTVERIDDDHYRIQKEGDSTWYTSKTREAGLDIITWDDGPAKGLSLTIPTTNTADTVFSFTKGISQMMYEQIKGMTDTQEGYVALSSTNLNNRIKSTDERIADLELDLESYKDRLVRQYANLEKAMSALQSQSANMMSALGMYSK